jgi:hypothetical protein
MARQIVLVAGGSDFIGRAKRLAKRELPMNAMLRTRFTWTGLVSEC